MNSFSISMDSSNNFSQNFLFYFHFLRKISFLTPIHFFTNNKKISNLIKKLKIIFIQWHHNTEMNNRWKRENCGLKTSMKMISVKMKKTFSFKSNQLSKTIRKYLSLHIEFLKVFTFFYFLKTPFNKRRKI